MIYPDEELLSRYHNSVCWSKIAIENPILNLKTSNIQVTHDILPVLYINTLTNILSNLSYDALFIYDHIELRKNIKEMQTKQGRLLVADLVDKVNMVLSKESYFLESADEYVHCLSSLEITPRNIIIRIGSIPNDLMLD